MRKFIMFAILCFGSWVAFAQVDIKRQGYYQVMVSDTVYSQHVQEYQAIETLLNLNAEGISATVQSPTLIVSNEKTPETPCDTITVAPEDRYVDWIQVNGKDYKVSEIEYMLPQNEVDTIDVTECWNEVDSKTWRWDTPENVWIPFEETGFSHVKVDSMPIWKKILQRKYRLERTRHHDLAKTEYKELEMPFQFMHDSIVSVDTNMARVRVFGSEDWYPEFYVDGVLTKTLIDATPGSQDFYGYITRRHTCTIDGLESGKSYSIRVKGYSRLRDEWDEVFFDITTK